MFVGQDENSIVMWEKTRLEETMVSVEMLHIVTSWPDEQSKRAGLD